MRELLKKPTEFLFLLIASFFFFILRLPSLVEPYWYGDEGIYQVIGYGLRHGRELYSEIWDNKPPLLYLVYALSGGDQFITRVLSLLFGLGALITFYFLAKKLFHSKVAVMVSTIVFGLLFATPFFEGNIANAENFMLFPILLAAYIVIKNKNHESRKITSWKSVLSHPYFFSGILLGLAFLFKIVAFFDLAAFALFLTISILPPISSISSIKKSLAKTHMSELTSVLTPLIIGFFLPILLTLIYFLFSGTLPDFLRAAFFNNVGYVGYGNRYLIPQGLLVAKVILLVLITLITWMKKEKLSNTALFVFLWFGFSLFSAFFSQRPYSHYVLVLLPAFSLMVGLALTLKNRLQLFSILILVITIILMPLSFWHSSPKKVFAYYENFLSFVTNNKDARSYQAFFDKRVPGDYDVVSYLKLHLRPDDQIFVWGNTPQLYRMVDRLPPGRFTVAYHMTTTDENLKESIKRVEEVKPKYIVVLPDLGYIPFYLNFYTPRVTIDKMVIYERTN